MKQFESMPPAIEALPRDEHGYPIPYFVATVNGAPDLRFVDGEKALLAVQRRLCWVCGQPLPRLGSEAAFVLGPIGLANRNTSEGPMHRTCAEFSLRHCPHLNNLRSQRRDADRPVGAVPPAGLIETKPPVMALWLTGGWLAQPKRVVDGIGIGVAWRLTGSGKVEWWREGAPIDWQHGLELARQWCVQQAEPLAGREAVEARNAWLGRLGMLRPAPPPAR